MNTPENRTSDDICFDCGRNYLTDLQLLMSGYAVTAHVSNCGLCEEKKSVTSFRHFNYLREKKMNLQELRRGLMIIGNSVDKLTPGRYTALVRTSSQKAMMWTGTMMKFTKQGDNPYAKHDGNRKTVEDIEPMFDATSDTLNPAIFEEGEIYAIDQIREYLSKQIDAFVEYTNSDEFDEIEIDDAGEIHIGMCLFNIYTHMTEARMWLGMRLGEIRDEAKG